MLKHIPNILTLGRLVLTVAFLAMVLYVPYVSQDKLTLFWNVTFVVFVVAGLTDLMDGMVARGLGVTSKFGRIMDPLADKVLVIGAFVSFAIIGVPSRLLGLDETQLSVVRWGIAAIITAREVYMTILRQIAEARGINFAATAAGKVKMALQSFTIGTIIIKTAHVSAAWGDWFVIVVLILTALVTIGSALPGARGSQRFPF